MSIYTDEIFGPVLSTVRMEHFEEAIRLIDENPYGNGTAIFTNDGDAARKFQQEVQVGMVGIECPDPSPSLLLQLRRLEGLDIRQPRHLWPGRSPLLYPSKGGHLEVGGPNSPWGGPGVPHTQLTPVSFRLERTLSP